MEAGDVEASRKAEILRESFTAMSVCPKVFRPSRLRVNRDGDVLMGGEIIQNFMDEVFASGRDLQFHQCSPWIALVEEGV